MAVFCLNFWILPRFFGVWAWKLTDLCHSSAPCFWIGQRVPLLLIVLKIYDRPWRCEMDSWLGVNKYPFFELSFERFRPMLWKIECFCDHCYLLNWYGVFLMSWHLFDEFFVVRVSYLSQRFSLPSLSSIVLCRSRRCRPLWTNYSVFFDSIFGTLLHN